MLRGWPNCMHGRAKVPRVQQHCDACSNAGADFHSNRCPNHGTHSCPNAHSDRCADGCADAVSDAISNARTTNPCADSDMVRSPAAFI